MNRYGLFIMCLLIMGSVSYGSVVITFDDIPSFDGNDINNVIREEYASLGVHFNSDGRHSGIVRPGDQADLGNWDLVGTNGPQFLGHNSFGLTGLIEFDSPISYFQVDVAEGHVGVVDLEFMAYAGDTLLEMQIIESSYPEQWETITLTSSGITRIEYTSPESFSLDNIHFVPEPATVSLITLGGILVVRNRRKKNV